VLVNRGFVPAEASSRASRQASEPRGEVNISGLLRVTEPYGAFLRSNDAAADRWFSRDVAAIATARGLANTAPYFIDAAAVPNTPATEPVGGLTVIAFPDNHLVYALTWFALALMVVGGAWRFVRADRQR
jgi:surfeit locus 1 family protein